MNLLYDQHTAVKSLENLKLLQRLMRTVIVPSWVERPPSNFGSRGHGKIKFDVWLKFFQIFLPLVAGSIWDHSATNREVHTLSNPSILSNIYGLAAITNLLNSKNQTVKHPQALHTILKRYLQDIQVLYPQCKIRPNHHYALHYPQIIQFSGPSSSLAVWVGERKNHALAKVKTNKQMSQYFMTILLSEIHHLK